eukprot:s163_g6.t1
MPPGQQCLIRQDLPERHLGLFASLASLGTMIPVAYQYFVIADLQLRKRRRKRIQEIIEKIKEKIQDDPRLICNDGDVSERGSLGWPGGGRDASAQGADGHVRLLPFEADGSSSTLVGGCLCQAEAVTPGQILQLSLFDGCDGLAKSGEIIMSPKQPDELHSTILAVKSLDPFLVETAPVLASIRQMFEVLESRYHQAVHRGSPVENLSKKQQVPRALVKRWYECIHAVPDLRDRAEKWQNIFRKDLRGKFNIRIAEKAKILSAQVQECRLVLEEYACKVSLTKAEFYYNKMHKLQERVAKLQEQVQKQHVHEEMMEMPLSEFPGLAATAEQIAPLLDLWFLAHDWNQWQDEILFGEFIPAVPASTDCAGGASEPPLEPTMNMGFGDQGMQSSQDCSFPLGTVCRAPIRLSYFVCIFFVYDLASIAKNGGSNSILFYQVAQATLNEIVLLLTILCHEFGHGNMARYLGGEISHILLWVFGGICFHTRPRGPNGDLIDNRKILRNDLMVVAAGPSTHFLQIPAWGLILALLFLAFSYEARFTGYDSAWDCFLDALNPLGGISGAFSYLNLGRWSYLPFDTVLSAIRLNVALFLFNVFFPMYPADGAKLLVTGLMFFCGVTPRKAAMVLICTSVPCGLLFIGWAIYGLIEQGARGFLGGLVGWMGVMSLIEARRIWKLRKARQLHTHSLFEVAKSWRRTERDRFGVVHRINQSDFDDDQPLTSGGWKNFCALFRGDELGQPLQGRSSSRCCCCCFFRGPQDVAEVVPTSPNSAHQQQLRAQRDQFVQRMQEQAANARQRDHRSVPVLHSLSLELTELRVLLPVIVSLRNPGLRERHWTLIGEAIDQNIQANQMKELCQTRGTRSGRLLMNPSLATYATAHPVQHATECHGIVQHDVQEMNLSNMNERFPFVAHLAKIQAISETASKEMLIEEELRRMQEHWAKLHFEFKPIGVFGEDEHRVEEESSSLVADLHHAEVWELITEQMAKAAGKC